MHGDTIRVKNVAELDLSDILKFQKVEEPLCRICFDIETDSNCLISPCKCNGSMKYVHEECLKIWILSSNQDMKCSSCDICKSQFTMDIVLVRVCSCNNLKVECFKLFIFPLVILLIGTVFSVVLIYLVRGVQKGNLSTEEKVYFALVIFACTMILVTILYILFKTLAHACCIFKMKQWHILSLKAEGNLDETVDANHQTELSHRDGNLELDVIENNDVRILPSVSRYRGRSIVTPQIDPAVLNRVNREAAVISRQQTHRSNQNTARRNELNTEFVAEYLDNR